MYTLYYGEIQHYMIKCVTCDRSVVYSWYSSFSTNKTDRHDITEILLQVALNTIYVLWNVPNSLLDLAHFLENILLCFNLTCNFKVDG